MRSETDRGADPLERDAAIALDAVAKARALVPRVVRARLRGDPVTAREHEEIEMERQLLVTAIRERPMPRRPPIRPPPA